ncbi:hypothetical protein LINPERPRIM_LOCUS39303 [Linum perenne]
MDSLLSHFFSQNNSDVVTYTPTSQNVSLPKYTVHTSDSLPYELRGLIMSQTPEIPSSALPLSLCMIHDFNLFITGAASQVNFYCFCHS